jgi:ribosomal protein L16/L10AE
MAERTIDLVVKPRLDAVVVRPGDTLVIRIAEALNEEQAAECVRRAMASLPGVEILVVRADQLLVYRPDGAASDG